VLRVRDLRLTYRSDRERVDAVAGVSFEVAPAAFYTLLGPSGCGKTSTLRCIAGLETPTDGSIEIGGTVVFSGGAKRMVPAYRRDIGMVFQSYAIWPHMTVFENVAFPLRHGRQGLSGRVVRDKVMRVLELVGLESYAARPAPLLSGGQQQRVALARALAREPTVLLLDEPLSNLDTKLRESMRFQIQALVRRLRITTLYVTHDQLEALTMSDMVGLMRDGRIVQEGSPRAIYLEPRDPFVANFLGRTNFIPGRVRRSADGDGRGWVDTRWGRLASPLPEWAGEGCRVRVGFRPEYARLSREAPAPPANVLHGTVAASAFAGQSVEYKIDLGDQLIDVSSEPFSTYAPGEPVFVGIEPERCYVLAGEDPDPRAAGKDEDAPPLPAPGAADAQPIHRSARDDAV
jgi:iron(III) transport system ATP-binding protein